jgi:hypothetical protein
MKPAFLLATVAGSFLLNSALLAQPQQAAAAPTASAAPLPATDGKVWGALVYATDAAEKLTGVKANPPEHLQDLEAKLGKVFPWKHFEIVGQHTQDVLREYESWVVPSADLFLKVDSKGPDSAGGVHLHIQFWRQEQVLLKTDALLRPKSPLFISGPKWREGQLLFVLMLTEEAPLK